MWVFGGIYYRIERTQIDFKADQMSTDYIGYANSNLNQPVRMHTYISPIKPFKDETDLEAIIAKHQLEGKKRNAD